MNWEQIAGKWTEYSGAIREKWGKFTDSDMDQIAGSRDQLIGLVQQRYGMERGKAQEEVEEYIRSLRAMPEGSGRIQSFEQNVRGKHVIAADGQTIGEVSDLLFDSERWHVQLLHLKLSSDAADKLRVARGRFHAGTADVPVDSIQSVGDTIILKVPLAELPLALARASAH